MTRIAVDLRYCLAHHGIAHVGAGRCDVAPWTGAGDVRAAPALLRGGRVSKARTTPADTCRANGWTVGTRLVSDEGYGPTVIEITAIGRESILAMTVSHAGNPVDWGEDEWTLDCRDWRVAT